MKRLAIISFVFFLFQLKLFFCDGYCDTFGEEQSSLIGCRRKNLNISNNPNIDDDSLLYRKPVFSGKCCWYSTIGNQSYGSCKYSEISEPFQWIDDDYSCFTGIEKCFAIKEVSFKDYFTCYSMPVEQPYSCCYIGNSKRSFCFPLRTSNKKVFSQTLAKVRTYYGEFDGDYEVICSYKYLKIFPIFILFLILF